ncbi:hypothetical protein [Salinilacihabitans rarus]|uniref:hypothetical protein n=1 Tax=Salinilacihabitans rarus TaxID=2961596 RepID=UPI0020C905BA|nr:hypothetical protein [Salinilacihabitans rarus]
MADVGYCTVEDLRRALRAADLPGDAAQDREIAIDAITAQTEWLQEETNRHWYEPTGLDEDTDGLIPTAPLVHESDEQDISTGTIMFADEEITPSTRIGSYTPVSLFRRDVTQLTELLVLNNAGGFDDWVASSDHTEGRGEDYFLQVDDADGWTTLYLDTESLDDEDVTDYRNAVVATYEYGIEGTTKTVRRAVAMKAAAQLLTDDETALGIPDNGNLVPAESKLKALERQAEELLGIHEDSR